jgi:hypothetical protein
VYCENERGRTALAWRVAAAASAPLEFLDVILRAPRRSASILASGASLWPPFCLGHVDHLPT